MIVILKHNFLLEFKFCINIIYKTMKCFTSHDSATAKNKKPKLVYLEASTFHGHLHVIQPNILDYSVRAPPPPHNAQSK